MRERATWKVINLIKSGIPLWSIAFNVSTWIMSLRDWKIEFDLSHKGERESEKSWI